MIVRTFLKCTHVPWLVCGVWYMVNYRYNSAI